MATAEFAFNNKIYTVTKSSPFKINYKIKLKMGFKIRKKRKHMKAEKFVKEMKEIYKKTKAVFKKLQEKIKKYAGRDRKEVVEYKVGDKVLLSTKDLMWQMRSKKIKKLTEKFVGLYKIKKIISENAVKLELPALMKIHLVVNVSRIVMCQEQIKR